MKDVREKLSRSVILFRLLIVGFLYLLFMWILFKWYDAYGYRWALSAFTLAGSVICLPFCAFIWKDYKAGLYFTEELGKRDLRFVYISLRILTAVVVLALVLDILRFNRFYG